MVMLGLIGNARKAAEEIKFLHPDVEFTSGRRTLTEQAHAMATNVVQAGRQWIAKTYKSSNVIMACQRWVDTSDAKTVDEIAAGILAVFRRYDDRELGKVSKHLTGQAFDVRPVAGLQGQLLLMAVKSVVKKYGGVFLENEGGLTRWHAQF